MRPSNKSHLWAPGSAAYPHPAFFPSYMQQFSSAGDSSDGEGEEEVRTLVVRAIDGDWTMGDDVVLPVTGDETVVEIQQVRQDPGRHDPPFPALRSHAMVKEIRHMALAPCSGANCVFCVTGRLKVSTYKERLM